MDKLPMCRICLAENVRMYIVNKTLHDLYEKLTDNSFITEDSRPILVCFICCAQLKKCYQFQKKCLVAEEQFAQMMMNEDYEKKPLINQDQYEFFHGFIKTPIKTISIVDVAQTESIVVKEEPSSVCERLGYNIEPKEEHNSNDDLKPVNIHNNYLDIEYTPVHHSESDSEDYLTLMKVKTQIEEQEASKRKRKSTTTNRAPVAKKGNLGTRPIKVADTITAEQKKTDPNMIQSTLNRTSKRFIASKPRVQNSIDNTAVDIDCSTNSYDEVSFVQDCKPYECDTFPNSFKQNSYLTKHIEEHSGEKRFKCNICQRSFRQKSHLTVHIRLHTGEKPFKCDICQSSFRQNSNLKSHIRLHTGEKRFKCDICHRNFRQKSHLTCHIRIHTGEKSFKCDICHRNFRGKSNLTRHISLVHSYKSYILLR